MARDWKAVMAASAAAGSVPAAALTEFDALFQAAESALATAQNETTRTLVTTAQCRAAFAALVEKMRDIKRRYFLEPPLVDADIISLGLKPRDTTHTMSGTPSAQVTIETYLVGRHELGIKIVYITGNPHDAANKGYRIWYRSQTIFNAAIHGRKTIVFGAWMRPTIIYREFCTAKLAA
jgi:hypothetical protein